MHKLKLILILFTTVALIIGIAFLPHAAATLQDMKTHSQAKQEAIQTIELHFGGDVNVETAHIPIWEKLDMMKQSPLLSISEEKASMTREEVLAAINTGLDPYYRDGLITCDWNDAQPSLTPYLAYGQDNNYCIFWETVLWGKYDNVYYYLSLYIDDETGKIISIDYQVDALIFGIAEHAYFMELFTANYFDSLELSSDADYWNSNKLVENISSDLASTTASRYTFGDVLYGEVTIEFYIHENGFYLQIPLS